MLFRSEGKKSRPTIPSGKGADILHVTNGASYICALFFLTSLICPDCDVQENASMRWRKHCPTVRADATRPPFIFVFVPHLIPLACIFIKRALQLDGSGSFGLPFPDALSPIGKLPFVPYLQCSARPFGWTSRKSYHTYNIL